MTDAERILQLLIHDLRTPLGVAQGYVRLLQDERLASVDERDRALARTMDALGHLSRICNDVSQVVNDGQGAAPLSVTASALADAVDERVRTRQFNVQRGDIDPSARVVLMGNIDRLADAIGVLLGTVVPPATKLAPSLHIETRVSDMKFIATPGELRVSEAGDAVPVPFDRWHNRGLAVPLACRVIDRMAGQVLTLTPAIVVTLPLEAAAV